MISHALIQVFIVGIACAVAFRGLYAILVPFAIAVYAFFWKRHTRARGRSPEDIREMLLDRLQEKLGG